MTRKRIKSRPDLFGYTNYYDERGRLIGKSRPGAFGSTVYFDEKGRLVGKSRKGLLAKEVYTDTGYNHIATYDSPFGEVHLKNGVPVGYTRQGLFDSAYTTVEAEDESCEEASYVEDSFEGAETEEEDYVEPELKGSQYAMVKNVQFFVLCLVICAVIYAIMKFN